MPDPSVANDVVSSSLTSIINLISASGALGTASMGLVDASKAFCGGPSNFGFASIRHGVQPFIREGSTTGVFGRAQVLATLKANWINGVAKADQKAKAKALIHLELTQGNAPELARLTGVDGGKLQSLAQKTASGSAPSQDEINVLGQFDAILGAVLDNAYEHADQRYRNGCKSLALVLSVILALAGGWIVYGGNFGGMQLALVFIVGLCATPLAPVAKDLATSLQTAVAAVRAVKR